MRKRVKSIKKLVILGLPENHLVLIQDELYFLTRDTKSNFF